MHKCGILLIFAVTGLVSSYEIGATHKYKYQTTVTVEEKCEDRSDSSPVGHRLKSDVHLTAVWEKDHKKLIKIEVLNTRLLVPVKSKFEEKASDLSKQTPTSSFLLLDKLTPSQLWDNAKEHSTLRNLKRGIATFLFHASDNKDTKEVDVSGMCDVIYTVQGGKVQRRKGNCVHSKFDKTLSQAYGVRSATAQHHSTTDCDWTTDKSPSVPKCTTSEYVRLYSNAWHRPSLCVNARSEMIFEGIVQSKEKYESRELEAVIEEIKKSQDIEMSDLESILDDAEEKPKKRQLKSAISKVEGELTTKNLAKMKSAKAFYKLLPVFRSATAGEILQVLNNEKLEGILPQLLDLVSACATENCLKAAFEFFEAENDYNPILERFLISLSIVPRPNDILLNKLKAFLEKQREERITATTLSTLGTVLKTYAGNREVSDEKLLESLRVFLEDNLRNCKGDDLETCCTDYLRGLRNAAQPRSAPVLLEYISKGGNIAMEALLGLKNIPQRLMPPQTLVSLLRVFNQVESRQDRSARALAAELILRQRPGPGVLRNLLAALRDREDEESSTFLASKIMHFLEKDDDLRMKVWKLLPENDVQYYQTLSQKGQSSLFRRPLVALEGTNVTFGLELEMLNGGLLKRTVFDVSFENMAGDSSLISVGIFASGLGAVAGEESGGPDDSSSPTAGLNLGFLDSALRPYVFFRSTGELMGHAWSGTASELTPVLQCLLAFIDDERIVVLGNGMMVRGQLRGALSVDSSAKVQISLWNRNSQSLVKSQGALLVRGAATVDAGFVKTQGTIQFSGQSGIDFLTDLEFYESPYTTCLQMEHPDVGIKFDVHRTVNIPDTKYQVRKTKKRTYSIPGRSFAFDKRNNEMCADLKSKDS